MPTEKLLAEWFWIDRWTRSRAFFLPMDARGIYREMLSQAWLRGARLPNDHEAIRRAIGATQKEWRKAWPLVESFWRVDGDALVNDTQLEVYAEARGRSDRASERGLRGAQALHKQNESSAQAVLKPKPPISDLRSPIKKKEQERSSSARSKRPIFTGQRFVVHEWQLDDLARMLGAHTNGFDLHEWFFALDAEVLASAEVIPQRDGGAWLQARTLAEAKRRGLTLSAQKNRVSAKGIQIDCPHTPPCASRWSCGMKQLQQPAKL